MLAPAGTGLEPTNSNVFRIGGTVATKDKALKEPQTCTTPELQQGGSRGFGHSWLQGPGACSELPWAPGKQPDAQNGICLINLMFQCTGRNLDTQSSYDSCAAPESFADANLTSRYEIIVAV